MKRLLLTASLLAGAAALATPAKADLVYNFLPANTFSGTAPAGTLTADFHTVSTGIVTLTIASNLAPGEFVLPKDGFYFNVISSYNASLLTLAANSLPPSVSGATLHTGSNAFKPDGDGLMDIELTFSPTNAKAFLGGEIGTFTITGAGVTENTFDALSLCATGCGHGSHYAAVHIGATPSGGSVSVGWRNSGDAGSSTRADLAHGSRLWPARPRFGTAQAPLISAVPDKPQCQR